MFKADKGGVMPPKQTSSPQNTSVGSGSRPMGGKVVIETSAPADAHKLERYDNGGKWLK